MPDEQSKPPDIGKLDGVPQRRANGGYYTQAEVDEIMGLPAPKPLVLPVESRSLFKDIKS